MGIYGSIGLILFFGVLILGAWMLRRSRRVKITLNDNDLKRATTILRLRNAAVIVGLLAISFHVLLASGLQIMSRDAEGYIARETAATYLLYTGLSLLAVAAYLLYIGNQPEFNFKRSLKRFGVKEKVRAIRKFARKPKTLKRKRTTGV